MKKSELDLAQYAVGQMVTNLSGNGAVSIPLVALGRAAIVQTSSSTFSSIGNLNEMCKMIALKEGAINDKFRPDHQ